MGRLTTDKVIPKIHELRGNLSAVARAFNVSRTTLYTFVRAHPTVQQAVDEAREAMLDHAESMLYRKILDGDTTALIFFLKTQGKKRGYVERVETTGQDGGPVETRSTVKHEFDYDAYTRAFTAFLGAGAHGAGDAASDGPGEPVDSAHPD